MYPGSNKLGCQRIQNLMEILFIGIVCNEMQKSKYILFFNSAQLYAVSFFNSYSIYFLHLCSFIPHLGLSIYIWKHDLSWRIFWINAQNFLSSVSSQCYILVNFAAGQQDKRHCHTTLLGSTGILLMRSKALFVCILQGKKLTKEAKWSLLGAMPWYLIMELKWCHPSSKSHTRPQADNIPRKVIPLGLIPLLCIM